MLQLGLDLIYLSANGFTVSTHFSSVDFRTNFEHTDKETRRKPSSTTACRQRARQPKLDLFGEQYRFMQRLHGLSWPHWPAGASPQSAQNDNWAIRNRRDAVVLAGLVLLPNIPSRHTLTHIDGWIQSKTDYNTMESVNLDAQTSKPRKEEGKFTNLCTPDNIWRDADTTKQRHTDAIQMVCKGNKVNLLFFMFASCELIWPSVALGISMSEKWLLPSPVSWCFTRAPHSLPRTSIEWPPFICFDGTIQAVKPFVFSVRSNF